MLRNFQRTSNNTEKKPQKPFVINEDTFEFTQGKPALPYNINDLGANLLVSKLGLDEKFANGVNEERKKSNFDRYAILEARMKKHFANKENSDILLSTNLNKIKLLIEQGTVIIES